jgi:hypothetical protein
MQGKLKQQKENVEVYNKDEKKSVLPNITIR